mmetsp:Transcript_28285/g.56667  ORF Transcript_28285/g.56667 Transcript_28285/m.56667 type:complete len:173 (+) Transcript_28285:287-805(+)
MNSSVRVLTLLSISFLASSQRFLIPNSELETRIRAGTVAEGKECNDRRILGAVAFKEEIVNNLSTKETLKFDYVLFATGPFFDYEYCESLALFIPGFDAAGVDCQTSIVYQTCLRVCRTVAVSVSSNDVCAEPYSYDNTSFRKLLVCQPQIIYFPESDVGSDAFIGSDTVIA